MTIVNRRDLLNYWGTGVAPSPAQGTIVLTPSSVAFAATVGTSNPLPQVALITNSGSGSFAGLGLGAISYGPGATGWLTARLLTSLTVGVELTPILGALAVGTYTASLQVIDGNASNSPQTLSVSFTVNATAQSPVISVTPTTFVFTGVAGSGNTADQSVVIGNSGGGTLAGLALGNLVYVSGSSGWLKSPTGGTFLSGNTITAHADLTGVSPGSSVATADITSSNASNSPFSLTITLDASAPPSDVLNVSDTQPRFAATQGGGNPATQTITITNNGGSSLGTVAIGPITDPAGFLTTHTLTGAGNTYQLLLGCTTGSLASASSPYTASFTITSTTAVNSPVAVTVTFSIAPVTTPGNFPTPLVMLPRGASSNASFDSTTNKITWDPFLNNGLSDPDGDPTSPTYYYTATVGNGRLLTATTRAEFLTHASTAAADPSNDYIIELGASISLSSDITLPTKSFTGRWTLIRPATTHTTAKGARCAPGDFASSQSFSYTGRGSDGNIFKMATGSHGWHFRGVKFANATSSVTGQNSMFYWGILSGGSEVGTGTTIPKRLKLEQCYFTNPWANGSSFFSRNGLVINGQYLKITGCYIEGMHVDGSESHGIAGHNGAGDYLIENNFIEGSQCCIGPLGGAPTAWTGAIQNNLVIRRNHLYKRPEWLTLTASGKPGQMKNFYEHKNARYVVIEDNYLQNHNGVTQQCDIVCKISTYSAAEQGYVSNNHVLIRNNFGINTAASVELSTGDQNGSFQYATLPASDIQVINNAFVQPYTTGKFNNIGGYAHKDPKRHMFNIYLQHNYFGDRAHADISPTPTSTNTPFLDNLVIENNINGTTAPFSAVMLSNSGGNNIALDTACGAGRWTFRNNAGAGPSTFYQGLATTNKRYASRTALEADLNDPTNLNYTVKSTSVMHNAASDNTDIGPDWTQLITAMNAKSF